MHSLVRAAIGAVIGSIVLAGAASAAPLADLQGSKRILLVFASEKDPLLARQTSEIAGVAEREYADRDLVVFHVPPTGEASPIVGAAGRSIAAAELRSAYGVEETGFTALLLGKDGGVNWRERRPAQPRDLFALIDSMPMRAREMKRNTPPG